MAVVLLSDVKAYLNIRSNSDDDELIEFMNDAVAAIEDVIGPITPTTVTEEFDEHGSNIVLSKTPVLSVQSVSIEPWLGAGAIDDTAAWRLNKETGVLRRLVVGGSLPFYGRGSIFTVTYTAGRDRVPGPVARAVLMQIRSAWKSQRGAMPLPTQGGDTPPPAYLGNRGFLAPEVMELLAPHLPPPGLA